jgi:hypothetical protein
MGSGEPLLVPGLILSDPVLGPGIPLGGLDEVLRGWSGQGSLLRALATIDEPNHLADRRWSLRDVQRRASRVMALQLLPVLGQLPTRRRTWLDALPVVSHREWTVSERPEGVVSWTRTHRLGWPPERFVARRRWREADTLQLTVLKWTLQRVISLRADVLSLAPEVLRPVADQLALVEELVLTPTLDAVPPIAPERGDLRAIRVLGQPWSVIAELASQFGSADRLGPSEFASALIAPDPELRWRLFHLAVLGSVLMSLDEEGARIQSLRPLGDTSSGPAYEAIWPSGERTEVWFEAAGVWSWHERPAPYPRLVRGLRSTDGEAMRARSLGPDILLLGPRHCALSLECKYSWNTSYVASGYDQAVTYATELRSALAETVYSSVVGPEEVVQSSTSEDLGVGVVGYTNPAGISDLVRQFLG